MLYVLKKLGAAVYSHASLPQEIEELRRQLRRPVIESLTREERYYGLLDIALLELLRSLRVGDAVSKEVEVNAYITQVKEYQMQYQRELQGVPASKFDVEKLAVAISEIALSLDKNLEMFDENSRRRLLQLEEESRKLSDLISQSRDLIDDATGKFKEFEESAIRVSTWAAEISDPNSVIKKDVADKVEECRSAWEEWANNQIKMAQDSVAAELRREFKARINLITIGSIALLLLTLGLALKVWL